MPRLSRNHRAIVLITSSILLGSGAQLTLKMGMNFLPPDITIPMDFPLLSVTWIMTGLVAYASSMLMWMMALSKYHLSFAYPLLSLSYILVYVGAVILPQLDETVSTGKTFGILLIVVGVIFVTKSKSKSVH